MIYDFTFFVFAAGAVISALLMVTQRNPVSSVIFLIAVFFCTSGLFLMLDAHYLAAINVILYGGAIMVLFLFVIMLLNLGHAKWKDLRGPLGGLFCGAIGVAFLAMVARGVVGGVGGIGTAGPTDAVRSVATDDGVVAAVARPLFADYVVVLEVTGLLLLVSMVGTILLARRRSA